MVEFFTLSLGAIGEKVTDRTLAAGELERWTAATADLLCSYRGRLQAGARPPGGARKRAARREP